MDYYLKNNIHVCGKTSFRGRYAIRTRGEVSIVQAVVLGVAALITLAAVVAFSISGLGDPNADTIRGEVLMWGITPRDVIEPLLRDALIDTPELRVEYVEILPEQFDARLTEALAIGQGPDVFIATHEAANRHKGKYVPIAYEQYPASSYTETFARVTHIFLGADGINALPLYIDPVVLLYNRSILSTAGYPQPAQNWIQMVAQVPQITITDGSGNILQSGIALGSPGNIHEMKSVYSALATQAGERFTTQTGDGGLLSLFGEQYNQAIPPAESALRFFAQFGNVDNMLYSWNSAFTRSDRAFAAGQVGYLLDHASNIEDIELRNPQIDIGVIELPLAASSERATYARVYAGYIARDTKNYNASVAALYTLLVPDINLSLAERLGLAPSRSDALSVVINDPEREVIRRSATYARSWLDPAPQSTELIISDMIRSVIGGQASIPEAVSTARGRFVQVVQ